MTRLKFQYFMDYEDGKIARVETTDNEGMEIFQFPPYSSITMSPNSHATPCTTFPASTLPS